MEKYHNNFKYLKEKWDEIFKFNTESDFVFQELIYIYNRKYHNFSHIEYLLRKLELHFLEYQQNIAMNLAIWFHDSIFNPYLPANEIRSKNFMCKIAARMNIAKPQIDMAEKIIMTNRFCDRKICDPITKAFIDLDYLIFSEPPKKYYEYTQKLKKEYKFIPYCLFAKPRKKLLNRICNTPNLFLSKKLKSLNEIAIENASAEKNYRFQDRSLFYR